MFRGFCVALAMCLLPPACVPAVAADAKKPNVLFIAIDDLNDWVHHLGGNPQAKTPHIDRLASLGVTMQRSYCAAPVCNPSRAALLSGLRPSTSGVYDNGIDWRKVMTDTITMPLHFKQNGYYVAGAGKIYHEAFARDSDWTEYLRGERKYKTPAPTGSDGVGGIKFAPLDCKDEDLEDYHTASWIIERMNRKHDQPFFLACGIKKPHMPWNVPRKYFDLFPLDKIELPQVKKDDLDDLPEAGKRMARPEGDHAEMLKSGRWKEAVQAYLAAGAFCDAMVGRVLDAYEKSPERDNTIVVLWGDHGWHLGEKQHWRKFALWEEATRAPLVWIAPGVTKPQGNCQRTVDFMSIYPTLCDLCGLQTPAHVEGASIRSLLADPQASWERPALTTHGRLNHAVRNEGWRYIRYADGSEELYDETKDPMEWTNLAGDAKYADMKSTLARWLPEKNAPEPKDAREPEGSKKGAKKAKKEKASK